MDNEFSNAYQEILLDNVTAIIKQNFIFQTQLKLSENILAGKVELEKRYNELFVRYSELAEQIKELDGYKSRADQNSQAHEEKTRIQTALNETMRKNVDLENIVSSLQASLDASVADNLIKTEQVSSLTNHVNKLTKKLDKIVLEPEKQIVFEKAKPTQASTPKRVKVVPPVKDGSAF